MNIKDYKKVTLNFKDTPTVLPQSVRRESISFKAKKKGNNVVGSFILSFLEKNLPLIEYTALDKWEVYEISFSPLKNLIIFNRIIYNLSDKSWTPTGTRIKIAKYFLF